MEEFPRWLKITLYLLVGLTAIYAVVGSIIQMFLNSG